MDSSSDRPAPANGAPRSAGRDYFDARRTMIDGFVARHFTWPGTLRLHRAALGWDILRAPLNVALSPILLLTRIGAYLFGVMGLGAAAGWLARRQILVRTSVAWRVEVLVVTDLLGLPLVEKDAARASSILARAVLAAPQLREMIRTRSSVDDADAVGERIARALADYASTRSAVAEMTTTLCVLAFGAVVFQTLTPGMMSMAPSLAEAMARTNAIASFPLGRTLGGIWYGVFAPDASAALVVATVAGLMMIGSLVAAFAGVLADPVQSRLGIHRRRLSRLLDTVEVEVLGGDDRPFVAREHLYARVLDLGDAAASILRFFRN